MPRSRDDYSARLTTPNDPSAAEEVAARIFEACGGAFELLTVWLGDHLGLYAAINEAPETTATELAERCRLDARYVQEWCDQQAIAGLLTCAGTPRRYTLAAGVREALLDPLCRSYVAPMTVLPRSVVRVLPLLLEAFVTGAGVPYAEYGRDAVEAQAALNRPWFADALPTEWIPAIPGLEARLRDEQHPAVVADLGCGVGWAGISLAEAYSRIVVHGYDTDKDSIVLGQAVVAGRALADRVLLHHVDGVELDGVFDLVLLCVSLHDMAHPRDVLRNARCHLAPGGLTLVMDGAAAETFTAPGDVSERFMAAASVLWCLPQGRTDPDSEAIGTLLRPATVAELARDAGYGDCTPLPVEGAPWRLYRLGQEAHKSQGLLGDQPNALVSIVEHPFPVGMCGAIAHMAVSTRGPRRVSGAAEPRDGQARHR